MNAVAISEVLKVERLTRELKAEARTMGREQARFLVDAYYQVQDYRKASGNQLSALEQNVDTPPAGILFWLHDHMERIEKRIKSLLEVYADGQDVGRWSLGICGVGPVISAGLLAHIDIRQAPTVGHIWRFAGLDPTVKWEKKTKRPWNARLKTLCWKIGESFVKVSGNDDGFYGHIYAQRKLEEQARNEAGQYADQAAKKLATTNIGKDTDAYAAYSQGILPPAHIHARAKRVAVKLFLAHWHHVAYESHYGEPPPKPYILTVAGGHTHYIPPPNWE